MRPARMAGEGQTQDFQGCLVDQFSNQKAIGLKNVSVATAVRNRNDATPIQMPVSVSCVMDKDFGGGLAAAPFEPVSCTPGPAR